eukprot:8761877-Pyramimonas_sp.AAC.1
MPADQGRPEAHGRRPQRRQQGTPMYGGTRPRPAPTSPRRRAGRVGDNSPGSPPTCGFTQQEGLAGDQICSTPLDGASTPRIYGRGT